MPRPSWPGWAAVSTLPDRLARTELTALWSRAQKEMARAGDGWATVRISLPLESNDQRHAIAGLLGRAIRADTGRVSVRLDDLDAAVRRAGDGWDLLTTVTAAIGSVPDRRGAAAQIEAAVDEAISAAQEVGPTDAWFGPWLDGLRADGTVTRLLGRGRIDALATAARVLAELPVAAEPLPSVAARLTGDTKALSSGPVAGLVLRGLGARLGEPADRVPAGAAARRERWESAGVVPDDLASQVLVLGIAAQPAPGLPGWLAEAAADGEPMRVTLHQLTRYGAYLVLPAGCGPVHVCENPAILRAAAERLGPATAPLVCTEGRPSVAATRLLDLLGAGGARFRVRADFDWPGVSIACDTFARLPGALPWRFTAADYEATVARRRSPSRSLDGVPSSTPWDERLAAVMTETSEAVYEEELLDDLLSDLATRDELR